MYIGIDLGTSAIKCILIGEDGRTVATASEPLQVSRPKPGFSEQDPESWWQATLTGFDKLAKQAPREMAAVSGIGLSGQQHGATLLDKAGNALRPCILWNDVRSAKECHELVARLPDLPRITGNPTLPGFTAPKLVWVRDHEPDTWSRVAHVLLPKDYVRLRLTGEHALDKADGAGTILFDLARRDWSTEILAALRIDPAWLPPTFEGPTITGGVMAEAAAATGLRVGTPVVAGGGDQSANAVGVGAVEPGVVALSLGTSGVVFATTDRPLHDPLGQVHAFCHAVPERWHLMTVMLSAAGSLRWFRDALAPGEDFGALVASAAEVTAAADGLYFLPYLSGERSPHPDPLARGAFVGLTVRHDRRHLTRAVLEGVAFGLRDGLDQMIATGMAAPGQVRASGGGTASALWRGILADVLQAEIATVSTAEGAAFGAALLAGVGAGWYADVASAAATQVTATPVAAPGSDVAMYAEAHSAYRELYPALAPTFPRP